jgi:hypothetical protein
MAMFIHPHQAGQLARQHHRERLADAAGQRLARTLAGATQPDSPAAPRRRRWLRPAIWLRAEPRN